MKKPIRLTVNGAVVSAEVEPRLQLADFLREELLLTGTHLGCEHGVCGACTVEIDGAPARSCIAYAVACDGAQVRTIEGYDGDPVMAELREAFSAEHALQCGYCTPGMLVTARDIVLRLPDADEACIREALAGNLCRCTGYAGIVRAIQSVIAKRAAKGVLVEVQTNHSLSPDAGERVRVRGPQAPASGKPEASLHQSFTVEHPRDKVWAFFERLDEVTACLPGASVSGTPTHEHVDINLRVKVGPIVAAFEGAADVVRDRSAYSGIINGSARDTRSSTTTRGEIRYALLEEKDGAATRVELNVEYMLAGALAQFGRSSLAQDIARRMTAAFAQNLEARLSQRESGGSTGQTAPAPAGKPDAGSLVFAAVWNRLKAFFRSLVGR